MAMDLAISISIMMKKNKMLTDWLIYLDLLEDYNYNTSFLRLMTPITFGIFECHYYNYSSGYIHSYGCSSGNGNGYGDGFGYGYGYGYGYGCGNGDGYGFGYSYSDPYDEEH